MGELVGNPKAIAEEITSANEAIATVEEGLAYIVGNTNTTGNTLAVGQFVFVKGHSTIPNGLRKVTASISNNGSITTSNTSPDTAGGLNTLNSKLANKVNYLEYEFTGTDTEVINLACADILATIGSSGSFVARAMRSGAHMISGYGVIRNGILTGTFTAFSSSGSIYIVTKQTNVALNVIRTI